ncbi:MAG: hypothetical protein QF619_09950, partial [Candidatus Binatia bacterium]|nr:hypothetical protein [Candidatus Binatia bacterium]
MNLKGLFSRQNLWPLLIGAGANAAATAFDDPVKDFFYGIWLTWLQLTDPGNMAQDNESGTQLYKISAILAGMTGVVIFS